ncbi:hypothetical protein MVEN_01952800 [Mycena venus]|uniref:Uncharacterized protein n=1 Tax=Mycena venus TaxID=2733690 RepID=A0A8H6XH16_9AGAR|nr:hypothetical protein MVEN_01952800 [Mycena venus]
MSRFAIESQTINIHGGTGGNGGRAGEQGGGGGAGEGPQMALHYDVHAEYFTVNNRIGTTATQTRDNFRYVNLGDLILYDEIDKQNVVERRPIYRKKTGALIRHLELVVGTRRVYRARIYKCQDPMTRRAEVQKAQQYRHPLLAELFGFTCSAGVNALIYHDDMMTISQIRKMHTQSALASFYIKYNMWQHFCAAHFYWQENTGASFLLLPGTAWIRLSTGKLCLDIGDGVESCNSIGSGLLGYIEAELPSFKLTESELHAKLLCALKLDEFHTIAVFSMWYFLYTLPSSTESITIPSICITDDRGDFQSHQLLTIPFPNHLTPNDIYVRPWHGPLHKEVMPTGWTRVEYLDNPNRYPYLLQMKAGLDDHYEKNVMKSWVSQQNYVCKHLQCAIGSIKHTSSYFPPQLELVDGRFTIMNPDDSEKYYWSFDPTGLKWLTRKAAEDIGLPTPQFSVKATAWMWDKSTPDMICKFHAAKGFNPDSQDAAIAMGYPLVDIKDIQKCAQDFAGKCSGDCLDDKDDDDIYYSIGLC